MNNLARLGERNRSWEVFGDFDDLMGHWFRAPTMVQREGNAKAPAMDVSESESAFMVKAEVPGVPREDLDVTINDGVLTISAERQKEKKDEEKSGRLIRQERYKGKFARSFRLGVDIDEAKVEAHYQDGVLNLVLPKTAQVQPRKVDIKIR
jgi:HSP20 family protein|tara:strand:+ start:164 stop:616 length:453 start_codon:yes stop_codon:yes gene_type:complete